MISASFCASSTGKIFPFLPFSIISREPAVALAIALAVAVWRGLARGNAFSLNCRYLSDGFFVSGMMLTGLGALIWISTTGFFDMLSYGVHSLTVLFSTLKKPQDHASFYDYKTARDAKRGKPRFGILFAGVGCILVSLLFLTLYYHL